MTITRLKSKNQVTLPQKVVRRLGLVKGELFRIEIEGNYLKLTPVEVLPKYSGKELKHADEHGKKVK